MQYLENTWWQLIRVERGIGSAHGVFVTFRYGAMSFRVYLTEVTYDAPVPLPRETRTEVETPTGANDQTDHTE